MQSTIVKIALAAILLVCSHAAVYIVGKQDAKAKIETAEQLFAQKVKYEQESHNKTVKELERKKNEEIDAIAAARDSLVKRLQQRPARPQVITEIREIREACTGRELYREDGEFLAGEAARAERVLKERDYYYNRYEEVRIMLERINNATR